MEENPAATYFLRSRLFTHDIMKKFNCNISLWFFKVQNCLLMKKMSDLQKSNPGSTKTLTDSTRKRHKNEDSAKYSKPRVSIGDEYDRWPELKDVFSSLSVNKLSILTWEDNRQFLLVLRTYFCQFV
jgi:hypothetical protein